MPKQPPHFEDVLVATEKNASPKRSWFTFDRVFISFCCSFSIGFLVFAYCVSLIDPDYFNRRVLATMRAADVDSVKTGAVEALQAMMETAMPAPRVVRLREPVPGDYQIITVFDREAIIATQDELLRVKVGSIAPGLGKIMSIDQSDGDLVIGAAEATLRSSAN